MSNGAWELAEDKIVNLELEKENYRICAKWWLDKSKEQDKRIAELEDQLFGYKRAYAKDDKRITDLEAENAHLKEELEMYSGYKEGGADMFVSPKGIITSKKAYERFHAEGDADE